MSNETQAEPKTAAQWQRKVEEYEVTLAGPSLEPIIKSSIEKLREHALQQTFLAEVTARTVNVDATAQEFVTPRVPDVMPVATAENLKMWDLKIAEAEAFLKNNPLPSLILGAKQLLDEAKESRARCLWNFQNPTPIPVPPPPPPIALPPEVVDLVREIVRAEAPSIVAQTIAWFKANPEWMRL